MILLLNKISFLLFLFFNINDVIFANLRKFRLFAITKKQGEYMNKYKLNDPFIIKTKR
jgi:hypothetical protein